MESKLKRLQGMLHLRIIDQQGVEVWSDSAPNLIVDTGYSAVIKSLIGESNNHIEKVAVGTRGNIPIPSDTSIANAIYVGIQSIEESIAGVVKFNFTVGYNDAVGMSIREFGLLTANGALFARKVREPIDKTEHMSIVGVWEIHI